MATKKDGTERKPRTKKSSITSDEPEVEIPEQPTSLTEPAEEETHIEGIKAEEPVTKFDSEVPQENNSELVVTSVTPEPEKVEIVIQPEILEAISKQVHHPIKIIANDERTIEEKIIAFVDSRNEPNVRLNDFLKSLYPVPKFNEPPLWIGNGAGRTLRKVLDDMVKAGQINIENNNHLRLGQFYYFDNSPVTQHHSLNTVTIVAKK